MDLTIGEGEMTKDNKTTVSQDLALIKDYQIGELSIILPVAEAHRLVEKAESAGFLENCPECLGKIFG